MEKNYAFKNRLFKVHQENRRNDKVWQKIKGTVIDDSWEIIYQDDSPVVENAALDLLDYFRTSMDLYPHLKKTEQVGATANKIIYEIDKAISGYKIIVDDFIKLLAGTDRMLAQASYALEEEMNFNEGPVLKKGTIQRDSIFSPRMTHSGFELDKFPDEHLLQIAHSGMDSLLLFVDGINISFNGFNDFNELIQRAAQYGLDVYVYSHLKSNLHPQDEGAKEYYEELYGKLFAECPGFKGVVLVGESIAFPSRDPRTNWDRNNNPDNLPHPGWFPCSDYPEWVCLLRDIIRDKKQDADIVFWTYNWGYVDTDLRLELINNLPTDITLLVTFEMFEKFYPEPGVVMPCADYTISFIGPGKYFSTEAEAAHKRGIRLYTISNTGGMTWDIGDVHYIPAPNLWGERCARLKESKTKWNLTGLMESHHYGWTQSFLSELIKNEYWTNGLAFADYFSKIIVRDYGLENLADMQEVWSLMSEGFANIVATNNDQYGPLRTGPSYPLLLEQEAEFPYKPVGGAHTADSPIFNIAYYQPVYTGVRDEFKPALEEASLGKHATPLSDTKNDATIVHHIKRMNKMISLCEAACEKFAVVLERMSGPKKENAYYTYCLCEFSLRTAITCANVKKWHILRCVLFNYSGESGAGARIGRRHPYPKYKPLRPDQTFNREILFSVLADYLPSGEAATNVELQAALVQLANDEINNARAAIRLVRHDSRLGWEPTMEYVCDESCLEWKIAETEHSIRLLDELKF